MLSRTVVLENLLAPPLPRAAERHCARDSLDLRDPLFHAMMKAHHGRGKSLATAEQTLAEMVLKMRLVDAAKR